MEDALLIRRIKQGDEAAFDALVRRHYNNIYAFCYRRCGDSLLAADLTQEVFLRLVTAIYRYSVTGKFTNYLLTIAVNVCNDHFRRKKSEAMPLTEDTTAVADAEAQLLKKDSASSVRRALSQLPDEQRDAVILRYWHDMKLRDIAAVTGVSTATAKISAGAAYSVLVWLIMTASAALYVFLFFGAQGFETLWQFSSGSISSPFPWTIGQAVIIELATCLIGTLFFAFIVMLLSELTRSTFASVILGAALLLAPMIIDIDTGIALYLPTYLMRGVAIWSTYFPAKLFGFVTEKQYLVIAAACIISAICGTVAVRSFARRQAA